MRKSLRTCVYACQMLVMGVNCDVLGPYSLLPKVSFDDALRIGMYQNENQQPLL